jgi:hypothetical protein
MPSQFDKEKTKKSIALILDKVKNEADPHLLNEYRSLFKKEVSLFKRPWAAAYLLMLYDQGALHQGTAARFDKNRNRQSGGPERSPNRQGRYQDRKSPENSAAGESWRNEQPRHPLPEEESRRLFISIGRNRRVFPREILGLINTKTAIPREDIGAIRILDNYSFVQVRSTVADTIIEALNGQPFRGRVLSVNYARARKDDMGEGQEAPEFRGESSGTDYGDPENDETGTGGEASLWDGETPEQDGSPHQDDDQPDEESI